MLGVVASSLIHPFWVRVLEGVEQVARERGYYLLLNESAPERGEGATPDLLATRGVNAILLLGEVPIDPEWLEVAQADGKTIVTVARDLGRLEIPSVTLDNRTAIELALCHLTELGHRRIALLGSAGVWEAQVRVVAMRDFFRTRGLPEPDDFLRINQQTGRPDRLDDMLADGAAALDELLARPEPPTAVISGSSIRATGLLGRANRRGISIPRDLSVVAFGDSALVNHTIPTLTALDERVGEQGRLAAELVLDRAEGKTDAGSIVLQPHLIPGRSTARVE
jgi:DNA-binding LacI/PurR family transcriptional regulator